MLSALVSCLFAGYIHTGPRIFQSILNIFVVAAAAALFVLAPEPSGYGGLDSSVEQVSEMRSADVFSVASPTPTPMSTAASSSRGHVPLLPGIPVHLSLTRYSQALLTHSSLSQGCPDKHESRPPSRTASSVGDVPPDIPAR